MASATPPLLLQTLPTRSLTLSLHAPSKFKFKLPPLLSPRLRQSRPFPPLRKRHWTETAITSAYVTGPASDPIVTEPDHKLDSTDDESSLTEKVQPPELISWSLLWSLLAKHKVRLVVCAFTLVGCTSCTLSMPIFSGRFFEVLIGARPEPLWRLLSKIGVLYALEPVLTVVFVVNMNTVWKGDMATLRAQIFRGDWFLRRSFTSPFVVFSAMQVEFFDRYKVGELSALLTSDLGSVKDIITGTICILFALAPQLAPILGFLVLAVSFSVAVYKRSTVPVFKAHGKAQASISDCVTETFSAIRTVRSFGGEKHQMLNFGSQVLAYQRSGIKLGVFNSMNESLTRVAVYIHVAIDFSLEGSKVKAVQGLVNTLGDLRGALAAIERINSVLSGVEIDEALAYGLERQIQKKEIHDEKISLFLVNGYSGQNEVFNTHYMSALKSASNVCSFAGSGDICLEDVHFSYPLRPDVKILNGLNLTLKCGTVTALVGSSGSGKSTVVQLLMLGNDVHVLFLQPTKGRITVSGEDVRTFEKTEWVQAISIVNQEPVLFSVSVGENIAYGLPDDNVSKDDIIKAAKAANAHEFIISLPQRIAIARALLKNAPILILDEATSALDAVSERLVQDALDQLMKGRTTLVIAHRLSTVQNANQIALCSDGRIAELGTHSELLDKKGQYASLVGTQRLAFE
uniref:ABC transporter domain-containing protein n=1 Tax=Salix viminalis TaxID=40686 RepID=A0A6N2NLE5_SALVM